MLVALAVPATPAVAAPEGFRLSGPLTVRAVSVGGNAAVTVHCARTQAVWREETADRTDGSSYVAGMTDVATREIMLPVGRCATLERWLRGRAVDMEWFADALFTFAHELAHATTGVPHDGTGGRDDLAADCYATRKYDVVARAFGVKRASTLRRLRNDAPLIPSLC